MWVSKLVKIILLACVFLPGKSFAQDAFPLHAKLDEALMEVKPMHWLDQKFDLTRYKAQLPDIFQGMSDNVIEDRGLSLETFFNKLRSNKVGTLNDSVRVLHVGDSHIRGHFFTKSIGDKLSSAFSALVYDDFGINGAVAKTFNRLDRIEKIKNYHPDLLILSFGTNESHNRKYNEKIHYAQLDDLVTTLRQELPNTPILLTTPPGSYERKARRVYKANPRTIKAVELIKEYAAENDMAYWDMYSVVGGKQHACDNWSKAKLMRPDHIHYLPEGYELQADLFCEAIIKAYNEYITL